MRSEKSLKMSVGFSLVEVMIALGVLSVGIVGVTEFMKMTTTGQKQITQSMEIDRLMSEITQVLSSPDRCVASLKETVATNPKFCTGGH